MIFFGAEIQKTVVLNAATPAKLLFINLDFKWLYLLSTV
jgi:hypothetical protein